MCDKPYEINSCGNYIIDTVIRIDKLQKEIVSDYNSCISCETSLVTNANNTIPVAFKGCSGEITAILELPDVTTPFFRIESVREKRFVTLRLLEATIVAEEQTFEATNHTCILDLNCVCQIQCFNPITVVTCTQNQ